MTPSKKDVSYNVPNYDRMACLTVKRSRIQVDYGKYAVASYLNRCRWNYSLGDTIPYGYHHENHHDLLTMGHNAPGVTDNSTMRSTDREALKS